MTNSSASTCVNNEISVAPQRKSKRKTAGRNPARYCDSSDNDEPIRPSQDLPIKASHEKSVMLCGAPQCRKNVSDGIECNNCMLWFHQKCAKLSDKEFLSHSSDGDSLWFCEHCLLNPTLRFLTMVIRRQERVILSLEDRVRKLELAAQPPHPAEICTITSGVNEPPKPIPSTRTADVSKHIPVDPQRTSKSNHCKEDLTVICTKVPESKSLSLKERHQDELTQWTEVCRNLGLNITPKSLTRLPRHPTSPHSDEPRLLRVTLKSQNDMEDVLLSAHLLRESGSNVRIFPDVPWHERRKRQSNPQSARADEMKKAVFIYGVPESTDENPFRKQEHDRREWQFVQELLGTDGCVTTSLVRLRPSPNYKGTGPRILKVTLLSEDMVETLMSNWSLQKRQMPPEVKLRVAFHPVISQSVDTETTNLKDASQQPSVDKITIFSSKNDPFRATVSKN